MVEEASDIGAIERTGEYRGLYHVLGGRLSPLDGIGPDELNVGRCWSAVGGERGARGDARHQPECRGRGDGAVSAASVAPLGVRVTRIARGLPVGGDLEYADGVTIAEALSAPARDD